MHVDLVAISKVERSPLKGPRHKPTNIVICIERVEQRASNMAQQGDFVRSRRESIDASCNNQTLSFYYEGKFYEFEKR